MTLNLSTKLIQFENKFAALEKDFNSKGMENLWRNPGLCGRLRFLNFRKTAFDKLDCTIKRKLTKWRIGKISAEQAYSQPPESKKLTARYNQVQTLKKAAIVAAIIFLTIVGVCAMAGLVIAYPPGLPLLGPFWLMWGVPFTLSGFVGGILSYAAYEVLHHVRVVRERRVEQSKDFHDFVGKYVNNPNNGFYATKEQMMDLKLHSLYKKYKRHINLLVHNVI